MTRYCSLINKHTSHNIIEYPEKLDIDLHDIS